MNVTSRLGDDMIDGVDHIPGPDGLLLGRPRRPAQISLKLCLIFVSLASILPLLLFVALLGSRVVSTQVETFGRDVTAVTRAVSAAIDTQLDDDREGLEALGAAESLQNADLVNFRDRMMEAASLIGASVTLASLSGEVLLTSEPRISGFGAQEDFLMVVGDGQWRVSRVYLDALSKRSVVKVFVPVAIKNGSRYILVSDVRFARIQELWKNQRLPEGWLGGVLDRHGVFVQRTANNDAFVGKVAGKSWRDAMDGLPEGWVPTTSLEGGSFYTGFVHSPVSGWSVGIGVPADEVWRPFWRWAVPLAGVGLAIVIGGLLLATWMASLIERPVRELAAARDIDPEDSVIRIREVDDVASALRDAGRLRRAAEIGLRHREERLRTVTDAAPFSLARYNASYHCVYANRGFAASLGREPDQLLGLSAAELNGETAFIHMKPWFDRSLAGETVEVETEIRFAHLGTRAILCITVPDRAENHDIVGVIVFLLDVTNRKRAEDAQREGEARWRALVEAMPQLVWSCRSDGFWDYVSPQWVEFTGEPVATHLGFGWLTALHPDDRSAASDAWFKATQLEGAYDLDYRIRHRDGAWRWFRARGVIVEDAARRDLRWIGTCTDIDEQRSLAESRKQLNDELVVRVQQEVARREAAQSRLAQAQKLQALGQLAGGIAHDFNNVLQTFGAGIRLILRHAQDGPRIAALGAEMEASVDRGAAITRRLLAFARRDELQVEKVSVGEVFVTVRDIVQITFGRSYQIEISAAADMPAIRADRSQLETVLINLAVNARDAMPEGGVIQLLAIMGTPVHTTGDFVSVSVIDTGTGMSAETLSRVTEPFFTTKPKGEGTGLGLAMARDFAEQSGGHFAIESVLGEGTRIIVWLPVFSAAG